MRLMAFGADRLRRVRAVVFAVAVLPALASVSHAAGAMAVGSCAAYGFAYDYGQIDAAQNAAMSRCTGKGCKVVADIKRACAAFAIDGRNSCGPHGYATARKLGQAENTALRYCYKYGGKDCVIRAWACDGKG